MVLFRFYAKKRESNVVNASADVVDDFLNQDSINFVDFSLKSPLTSSIRTIQPGLNEVTGHSQLYCTFNRNAYSSFEVFMPFDYLCSSMEVDEEYFFAFSLDVDISNSYMPTFVLYEYDENNEYFDHYNIDYVGRETSVGSWYWGTLTYQEGHTYFIRMLVPVEFPYDYFYMVNVTVKYRYNKYTGYSYTYDELKAMYLAAIEEAYNSGVSGNDGYDRGYENGYREALNSIYMSLYGLFSYAECSLETGVGYNDLPRLNIPDVKLYGPSDRFELGRTMRQAIASVGYDPADYSESNYSLIFSNFPSKVVLLDSYSFRVTCSKPYTSSLSPFDIQLWTDFTVYESEFVKLSETELLFTIDLSSRRPTETLDRIDIDGYMNWIVAPMQEYTIYNGDMQYLLGFDYGYWQAYGQFQQDYDIFLNQEYEKGFKSGEKAGYDRGYNEGADDTHEFTFSRLIGAVIDVPIHAFTSLFNFELLGVNLANFFFALLTVCIVLAVIKLIL